MTLESNVRVKYLSSNGNSSFVFKWCHYYFLWCVDDNEGYISTKSMRKIAIIFLSISLNMCFRCSREPSHRDGSFEHPQHMSWLRNKKNSLQLRSPYLGA